MKPELSVIIPLYNHENFIEKTLDCLAAQALSLEIIVINDQSTDNSSARVKTWKASHETPLTLVDNDEKMYALRSRLKGVEYASADNIMFVDADDSLCGTQELAVALQEKHATQCDIIHFRSTCINPKGENTGEALFNAPLSTQKIIGDAIFAAYVSRKYPPVTLWGKIFSKTLLEKVSPIVQQKQIYRFEDKLFVSLCMLYAKSYKGCHAYVYNYKLSDIWSIEKYAGRAHDLFVIYEIMQGCMQEKDVAPATKQAFNTFVENRLTNNVGLLCLLAQKDLQINNTLQADMLKKVLTFLPMDNFLMALFFSLCTNIQRIENIEKHLYAHEGLPESTVEDYTRTMLRYYFEINLLHEKYSHEAKNSAEIELLLAKQARSLCKALQKNFNGNFPHKVHHEAGKKLSAYGALEDIICALIFANAHFVKRLQNIFSVLKMN